MTPWEHSKAKHYRVGVNRFPFIVRIIFSLVLSIVVLVVLITTTSSLSSSPFSSASILHAKFFVFINLGKFSFHFLDLSFSHSWWTDIRFFRIDNIYWWCVLQQDNTADAQHVNRVHWYTFHRNNTIKHLRVFWKNV